MIRYAMLQEQEPLKALYQACFPGEAGFCHWFFHQVWQPENTLIEDNGAGITSALQMLPFSLRIDEEQVDACYIYAAGTAPGARGQGAMGRLLAASFELSLARGQQISMLIVGEPSLFDYYSRFGYQPAGLVEECCAPATLGEGVRLMEASDLPAVDTLYRQEMEGRLYVERDALHWTRLLELYRGRALIQQQGNSLQAYGFWERDQTGLPFFSEAVGPGVIKLAGFLAQEQGIPWARYRGPDWGDGQASAIGALKPLTPFAQAMLDRASKRPAPYLNLLFN